MQKAGKILVKNVKTLITGSSTRLGNALAKHLVQQGSKVFTVDQNVFNEVPYGPNHHFEQMDLAKQDQFRDYLKRIEPIDALVNCAGFRSSYNYFLTYLISKQILEKMEQNPTNEYGCRGCIINLVFTGNKFGDEFFREQDEFIEKYKIDPNTIDDEVYRLADLLTAARIRCNTLMIDEKLDEKMFTTMVQHVIEDQYVAGQVINMEDNLRHRPLTGSELKSELTRTKKKEQPNDEDNLKYVPPPEMLATDNHKCGNNEQLRKIDQQTPIMPLPNKT